MIKLTRYCENCKEEVEAVVIDADSVWCPNCLDDLKYYDYDREMADEEAVLMEFERFSGAMDIATTTRPNKQLEPTPTHTKS